MEDYEKEMKKLFINFAISVDETQLYCPNKWKLLNRKIKNLFLNPTNKELEAERDALQESEKLLMMLINDAYKSATGTPSKKTTLEMMRYVANRPKLQQLVSNGDSKEIKKYRSCEKLEGEG